MPPREARSGKTWGRIRETGAPGGPNNPLPPPRLLVRGPLSAQGRIGQARHRNGEMRPQNSPHTPPTRKKYAYNLASYSGFVRDPNPLVATGKQPSSLSARR